MQYPTEYQYAVHQVGLAVTWSFLFNVAIVAGILKYSKIAAAFHAIFGVMIWILTYLFILWYLIPIGFNVAQQGWQLYGHGVLGLLLLGFVVIQVLTGLLSRFLTMDKKTSIFIIKILRKTHHYLGYLLAIAYKILVIWAWYYNSVKLTIALTVWEIVWIAAFIVIKIKMPMLEGTIIDGQTQHFICPEIGSIKDVTKVSENYVIFANYVYDARNLQVNHPGGYRVAELVKGREVDRFLYGMYSAELYPELPAYSHSAQSLELVGSPIAKLVTPPTYEGFGGDMTEGTIKYMNCIAEKTQIYSIGIVQKFQPFRYLGYSDVRQLGQYHSFTIKNNITRLYTAVNFLTVDNMDRMNQILEAYRQTFGVVKGVQSMKKPFQTELPVLRNPPPIKQRLLEKEEKQSSENDYLPLMLKIYSDGKLTSALKAGHFYNITAKVSIQRGRGLELDTTKSGRIIVVAGGTGLFPFSDTIDLLFKAMTIEKGHKLSRELLAADPILKQKPFNKFFFVFLIAVAEPEDIHPVTYDQLVRLSENQNQIKIALRVSKNADKLQRKNIGKIEFTRDYFTKRVVAEAAVKNLSRIWICGPPKLNTDTAKVLIENGYTSENLLLV